MHPNPKTSRGRQTHSEPEGHPTCRRGEENRRGREGMDIALRAKMTLQN